MAIYDQMTQQTAFNTNPYPFIAANGMMGTNGMMMVPAGQYPANIQRPMQTQALTKDEISQIKSSGGAFDISLTQIELLKGFCTHKDPDTGNLTLIKNNDGSLTCAICGRTFNEELLTRENTEGIVKRFVDLLQTIKTSYPDMPVATARQFFSIIPLAEKVPSLADLAAQNMSKYQNISMVTPGSTPYGFNTFSAVVGGPAAYTVPGYSVPGQQMYMAMAGQPNAQYTVPMPQAPVMAPQAPPQVMVTAPAAGNEFGYYGNGQMSAPIAGQGFPMNPPVQAPAMAPGPNMQVPGVYAASVDSNGNPIYMPTVNPTATVQPPQPAMAPQAPAGAVSAQPNTASVSMPMAQPVADPSQQKPQAAVQPGQPAQGAIRVDTTNFSV